MTHLNLASRTELKALAASLPDIPRWVEVRSMLLRGQGTAQGLVEGDEPVFVAEYDDHGQASVVGRPAADVIRDVASRCAEMWAVPENSDWVNAALLGWKRESADIHLPGPELRLPEPVPGLIRVVDAQDVARTAMAADLRKELKDELGDGTRILGAWVDGQPVAFCYAGSVTEGLADVGIDTLEGWRRRGYALQVAAAVIRDVLADGRTPVWGAMDSNIASRAMAMRLGFVKVDTLVLFSPPA